MSDAGTLELAFLGSGNAFAPSRCWSGFLLNGRYLFDAPPTALYSLKRQGHDLGRIDTVLVSHFHADHFFGLPFLLLQYAYETARDRDLTIVGPPGIEQRLHELVELGYPGLFSKLHGFKVHFCEASDGLELEANGLKLAIREVAHGGDALRSFGFHTELHGKRLAYTGDSQYCDSLVDLGKGCDVMVSDCTYPAGRANPEHMSLDEVRDLQARVGGSTAFVLTHLSERVSVAGMPRTIVAEDGLRLRF